MANSWHKRVESRKEYNRATTAQIQQTDAVLGEGVSEELDEALAIVSPDDLAALEEPIASVRVQRERPNASVRVQCEAVQASTTTIPINFAGATFSNCSITFSMCSKPN